MTGHNRAIMTAISSSPRGRESGIAKPVLVPSVTTAIVALLHSREQAAPLDYIGGSLGTLIGADLLNLGSIRGLGAPVASIGGAFDATSATSWGRGTSGRESVRHI